MKIEDLKQIKEILNKIPDDVLQHFVIGQDEDGEIALLVTKGDGEGEMIDNWDKYTKQYRELNGLALYIRAIGNEALDKNSESYPVNIEYKEPEK